MSRGIVVTLAFAGEDGSQAHTAWEITDADAAHALRDQLGGLLGEPVVEVVMGISAVAAIRAAADADGGILACWAGDSG